MEAFYGIAGLAMIYSVIHFLMVQNTKTWKYRTEYEKLVTVAGIISISLVFLGVMFGD